LRNITTKKNCFQKTVLLEEKPSAGKTGKSL
jgi:hypothetical protein